LDINNSNSYIRAAKSTRRHYLILRVED